MDSFLLQLIVTLIKAWSRGTILLRVAIVVSCIASALGAIIYGFGRTFDGPLEPIYTNVAFAFFGFSFLIMVIIYANENVREQGKREQRIEKIEEQVRENPERPQLAWDLARTKLENYLDRNLRQLRSIFWLTSFVMIAGFGFVLFGLMKAYDKPESFPVTIVASVSGVIISFIGGSFLLIYQSILAQTKSYVSVLERINAVGMAVQVLGSISEKSDGLKDQSVAALAKQLIDLYSKSAPLDEVK